MDDEEADAEDELHAALYADAEDDNQGGGAAADEDDSGGGGGGGGGKGDGVLRLGGRGVDTERAGGVGSSGLIMKVGFWLNTHTCEKADG